MGIDSFAELLKRHKDRVQSILNILIESPYFYRTDDRNGDLFPFLLRHKTLFREFFEQYYGWDLIIDSGQKCARVYKSRWYNSAISEGRRFALQLTRRDETLAFMLLLEFFELQLDEQNVSVEEPDNLRFYSGDLLVHVKRRLHEEYPERIEDYSEESVRRILRELMPKLVQFRLLSEVKPPEGEKVAAEQMIFEALPALYHYNGTRLSFPVFRSSEQENSKAESSQNSNRGYDENEQSLNGLETDSDEVDEVNDHAS
ncbi:MAG: DUF2398 family protein [Candidatus Hatepunaea meridiana]|nr:DUF2398 family protein [Candidatus Hatepunaea meridiana]